MQKTTAGRQAVAHITRALEHLDTAVKKSGVRLQTDIPLETGETPDVRPSRALPNQALGMYAIGMSHLTQLGAQNNAGVHPKLAHWLETASHATGGSGIALYIAGAVGNAAARLTNAQATRSVHTALEHSGHEFDLAREAFEARLAQDPPPGSLSSGEMWQKNVDYYFNRAVEAVQAERDIRRDRGGPTLN